MHCVAGSFTFHRFFPVSQNQKDTHEEHQSILSFSIFGGSSRFSNDLHKFWGGLDGYLHKFWLDGYLHKFWYPWEVLFHRKLIPLLLSKEIGTWEFKIDGN